ncbi:MAG: nitrate ABC transporter permease [Gloeobacterales cyanobacterium]
MTAVLPRNSTVQKQSKKPSWIPSKSIQKTVAPVIAIALFLGIWQLLTSSPEATMPGPIKVVTETWPLITDPFYQGSGTDQGLFWQIMASLKRVAIGFSLSALVGITVGILIGANPLIYSAVDPLFQVLRTIPPLAWLPISLAAIQQSEPAALFVIFITAIWPIIINTAVGVQQIPQDYNNVARVLRLSKTKYFFKVLLPSALPYIFTGLKIGVGLSWLAIVAAEMLIGGVGIGFFIWDAYNAAKISDIILALFYVGLVGLLLDKFVSFIGSRLVPEEQK